MKKTVSTFLIILLTFVTQASVCGMDSLPIYLKRFCHLFLKPDDLFDPVVQNQFNFWDKGYSEEIPLRVKYDDRYAITIECLDRTYCIPSGWGTADKYQFKGIIRAEFFCEEKLILSRQITEAQAIVYQEGEMDCLRKIILLFFDIPIKGKYKNDIRLRLSVLKPDLSLREYAPSIQLTIAVSGTK